MGLILATGYTTRTPVIDKETKEWEVTSQEGTQI